MLLAACGLIAHGLKPTPTRTAESLRSRRSAWGAAWARRDEGSATATATGLRRLTRTSERSIIFRRP